MDLLKRTALFPIPERLQEVSLPFPLSLLQNTPELTEGELR